MSTDFTVAIIGGGIGGLVLAIGLAKAGVSFKIFEAARSFGEVGAGISFGRNALNALSSMGLREQFEAVADKVLYQDGKYEDVFFEWRYYDKEEKMGIMGRGAGANSAHRAEFLDILVKELPDGHAEFGKRCVKVEQTNDTVRVSFEDGTSYECDGVIGSDGIKSRVRTAVLGRTVEPLFTGTQVYRGLIPMEDLQQAMKSEHLANVPQMWLGPDRHILTFPIQKGKTCNMVAFVTDRSKPNPTFPADEPWVRPVSQEEMLADYKGWAEPVQGLLSCVKKPTKWALHELPVLDTYVNRRIMIMGDAAHAMLPHQGAGAGQAIEDAQVLAALLAQPQVSKANIPTVFKAWEQARQKRGSKVQSTSHECGDVFEFAMPDIGKDRNKLDGNLSTRWDWIWQYDTDAGVDNAILGLRAAI